MLIRGEFQNIFLETINYGKEQSYRGHIALDQVKIKDKVVIYRALHWMLYRAPPLQGPSKPIPPSMHMDLHMDLLPFSSSSSSSFSSSSTHPYFSQAAEYPEVTTSAGTNEEGPWNRSSVQDLFQTELLF